VAPRHRLTIHSAELKREANRNRQRSLLAAPILDEED
jgi:hypothetical protein